MLVSVVIPAYNQADYLREAIQSVLDQTYRRLEIIVVDDGSTDHTREVCQSFGSQVRYFYQEQDGTLGASALIRAVRETRGEFIAFLDHDDRWLPTKIEKQMQALATNPKAGAAFTYVQVIDSTGSKVGHPQAHAPSGDVFHQLLTNCYYAHSAGLVRRSALARVGLPDLDTISGDWDQWLRIARHYHIVVVDEPLTEYRTHGNNFSKDLEKLLEGGQRILRRQRKNLHPDCRECEIAWGGKAGIDFRDSGAKQS